MTSIVILTLHFHHRGTQHIMQLSHSVNIHKHNRGMTEDKDNAV